MGEPMNLNELKAGDLVINHCGNYSLPRVVRIDRLTPTQIIIGNTRFPRNVGDYACAIGGSRWTQNSISVPKPGEIEKCRLDIKRQNLQAALRDFAWGKIKEVEVLESVLAQASKGIAP